MITPFLLAVILIVLYEGLPLFKNKLWRELGALGMLIGLAAFLGIADMWGMPTPVNLLEQLLGPIGQTIFK